MSNSTKCFFTFFIFLFLPISAIAVDILKLNIQKAIHDLLFEKLDCIDQNIKIESGKIIE